MDRKTPYKILLSNDATGLQWQLGPLPPRVGSFALIGWTTDSGDDGGIPTIVGNVLARALVRHGRLTFPYSGARVPQAHGWHRRDSDYLGTFPIRVSGGWSAAWDRLRQPTKLHLLSTVREEPVRALYDDPNYPWWHQGQFALLSPTDTPPNLAALGGIPARLIEPEWADTLGELMTAGVESILRPGVDGSVAGLLCSTSALRDAIENAIVRAAAELDVTCEKLSEDEFADSLSARK